MSQIWRKRRLSFRELDGDDGGLKVEVDAEEQQAKCYHPSPTRQCEGNHDGIGDKAPPCERNEYESREPHQTPSLMLAQNRDR